MKIFKNILAVVGLIAALAFVESAKAQAGRGYDLFGPNVEIVAIPMTSTASVTGGSTNLPMWLRGFTGIATLDVYAYTNTGTNVVTFTPQFSYDNTNWTTLTNFAVGLYANTVYSNFMYANGTNVQATNLYATNFYILAKTNTTLNIATSGFAGPSPVFSQFTNGAALTFSSGTNNAEIAWEVRDTSGYLRVNVTTVGTNVYGATLHAVPVGN